MKPSKILITAIISSFFLFGCVNGYIVINEFESNPDGTDADNEWVELYNDGDFDVDVTGWTLVNGDADVYTIPSGIIMANGYMVQGFSGSWLDNSNENVSLFDEIDELVDSTDTLNDGYNDERTWQRIPDGTGGEWQLLIGTQGASNDDENAIPEFPAFIMPVFLTFAGLSVARRFCGL